jgi:hypothetical protein
MMFPKNMLQTVMKYMGDARYLGKYEHFVHSHQEFYVTGATLCTLQMAVDF